MDEEKEAKEINAIAELERFAFPGKSEKPFVLRTEQLIMSREVAEDAGIDVKAEALEYEACTWCKRHRDSGDLGTALRCRSCGGTGIITKGPACNGCGGSLYPKGMNSQVAHGLENVVLTGGYDSSGLLDLHRYTFSLCETCIRTKVLMTCKLPPKVESLGPGGLSWEPLPFAEDQEMWEYAEWRRSGGHATASLHRICNATLHCGKVAAYSVAFSGEVGDDCLCEDHKDRFRNCLNAEVVPFVPWTQRGKDADGEG